MKRRVFLSGILAGATLIASAGVAMAASYTEDVVAQLVSLGFQNITAETTLLGRVKIQAIRADGMREIVINPRTGEILRDVWVPTAAGGTTRTVLHDFDDDDDGDSSGSGSSGSGTSGGSGSGDDGGDDDGGDDDNSGHGGGDDDSEDDNSGHGSDDDSDDDREDREDREDRDKKDD